MAPRLALVVAEAREMLAQISAQDGGTGNGQLRIRLAAWIMSLERIAADADAGAEPLELTVRGLLAKALSGADIDVDGIDFSLHDITQLAAALRPGASLTVRNSDSLSPIEQTSIWTVMPGQVRFA
ncbi:hypothetical protein [Beijerinckia sp. L45]|uniref:hypothetical protein n=1 Tax=Beijerinckia sp. L45 TaxID=1641855 RepID=UPI00131B37D3|nr:hypothetical protein [Beijerinckia sp. L45]